MVDYFEEMELTNITFQGPEPDDFDVLDAVPENLRNLLRSHNGFILFGGGLHVRGACFEPLWHSLRHSWRGPEAFHKVYSSIDPAWIPFAEDCVGDQFILADNELLRLSAETGDVERLKFGLSKFLDMATTNPIEFLSMEPLLQLQRYKGQLQPGQLVHAYPPFCTEEAANGVSLRAVMATDLHRFHSELASQLPENGERVRVIVTE